MFEFCKLRCSVPAEYMQNSPTKCLKDSEGDVYREIRFLLADKNEIQAARNMVFQ